MNEEYLNRYSRQLKILGDAGQEKLRSSKVGVAGVGGLGSTVTMLLAAAGVGKLVLVDDGEVELSNLNRQILYTENDLGKVKVEVASKRLRALNSGIEVIPVKASLHSKEAQEVLKGVDVLVDCLDNWDSRIVLDKLSWRNSIPFVHAGISEFYGQSTTVVPGITSCLKCLLGITTDTEGGLPQVISPTASLLGAVEAAEVMKLLTGIGEPLTNRLLVVDLKRMDFTILQIKGSPKCRCY